ncbi:MAG: hypothetical protein PF572_02675 [Patescibacteria group bacterium]|jgi:hypothetical protein|nr:hypothetical protein [Patescibacteria group bacterium]
MNLFKFGKDVSTGNSAPYKFLLKCSNEVKEKLQNKLEVIEKGLNVHGPQKMVGKKEIKDIKHCEKQETKLYQINYRHIQNKQYRVLFVIRTSVYLILEIFLKKSDPQEQKMYSKALEKNKHYE